MLMSEKTCWSAVSSPTPAAETPAGRHSHSAVVHQHRMWVYGGLSGLAALDDLWTWYFGKYSSQVIIFIVSVTTAYTTVIFGLFGFLCGQ